MILFSYYDHQIFLLDLVPFFKLHIRHRAIGFGLDVGLHLHRLGDHQYVSGLDRIARLDVHLQHLARHRRGDVAGIPLVGLNPYRFVALYRLVTDNDGTIVAVQLEINGTGTVLLHFSDRIELDDQGLARFDIQGGFLPRLKTVEKDRRRDNRGVGVFLAMAVEFGKDIRVEDIGNQRPVVDAVTQLFLKLEFLLLKIDRLQQFAGTAGDRLLPFQDNFLQFDRPPQVRLSEHPLEHAYNRLGKGQILF